ncbi:MAG: SIMPL domain-containing protein [Solirubrobacteraceae bacterium]
MSFTPESSGVPGSDRSTAGVSVHEEFNGPERGNLGLGQRATARVVVQLADPAIIGRLISRASEDLRAGIALVEPAAAANQPPMLQRNSARGGGNPIDTEEPEVRAQIDATFALAPARGE